MKDINVFISENLSKKVVKKNQLIDKDIQNKIIDGSLDLNDAQDILNQYNPDYDNYEENGYDGDIDQLSSEVDFKDYIEGELKGSINDDIATQLDILGVDQWYFGLLSILNKDNE